MLNAGRESTPRRTWASLAALLLLAFAVRAAQVSQPFCISRDGVRFVELARKFTDDPIRWMRIETKQPGYPLLLAGARGVAAGDVTSPLHWETAGRRLTALCGCLAVPLIYLLAYRLFDARVAAVAGVFAALWPQGVHLSADVLSDMPHLALYLTALLLAWRAIERVSWPAAAAAGLIAGLAYLVRQEAVGLLPAVALCALRANTAAPMRRRAALAGLFVAAFVVAVAPHSVAVGQWMPNKNPADFLDDAETAAVPGSPAPATAATIPPWQAPGRMAESWAKSGRYVFATLFLICLFVRSMPRGEPTGRDLLAAAAVAQLVLVQIRVSVYGEISGRYLVIPAALCIPWAAAGFVTLTSRVAGRIADPTPARQAAVWLSGFLLVLTPLVYYATAPLSPGKEHYRRAGLWLADRLDENDVVVAPNRLEQVQFYAGRAWPRDERWRQTGPGDDWPRVARTIARSRAAWYVDARGSRRDAGHEAALFAAIETDAHTLLSLERREAAADGEVFIWRVRPAAGGSDKPRPSR